MKWDQHIVGYQRERIITRPSGGGKGYTWRLDSSTKQISHIALWNAWHLNYYTDFFIKEIRFNQRAVRHLYLGTSCHSDLVIITPDSKTKYRHQLWCLSYAEKSSASVPSNRKTVTPSLVIREKRVGSQFGPRFWDGMQIFAKTYMFLMVLVSSRLTTRIVTRKEILIMR